MKKGKPERVREKYDVVVAGGGMAGLCAALASARNGAKTVLVQARPVLGGNASSEIRMHICGASENGKKPELEESGIVLELMLENKSRNDSFNYSAWDMVLWSAAKAEKNLTLRLNAAVDACREKDGKIAGISAYQQTTEKRYEIEGKIYIDATGNGTLGYFAGAEYKTGSESRKEYGEKDAPEEANGYRMGNSILFRAVDRGRPVKFAPPRFAKKYSERDLRYRAHSPVLPKGLAEMESEEYLRLAAFGSSTIRYGYWWIELSGKTENIIGEYEEIRDELEAAVYGVWDHIKNGGDHGAENYELDWVGFLPGVRESRRLVGDYVLTENDVLANRRFADDVAYGGWAIDVHTPNGLQDVDEPPSKTIAFEGSYGIPYRCYYSKNIENLMMAGRNISASKLAFASARVMGTCAIGGQAAGTAAAMCVKYRCTPRELGEKIKELQQQILKDGGFIPGVENEDGKNLARSAEITASTEKDGKQARNVIEGPARQWEGKPRCWESDGMSEKGEWLKLCWKERRTVREVRLTFESNFNYAVKITMSDKRQAQQREGVPPELVKDYTVSLTEKGEIKASRKIEGNHQRLNEITFSETECDGVLIHILATNGYPDAVVNEVRIY